MADTNQSRRSDSAEFSDNDPFAELTRIMGHDPRSAQPAQAGAQDDFDLDLDLEKELMGDLDFKDFDDPQPEEAEAQASAPEWQDAAEAEYEPAQHYGEPEPVEAAEDAIDFDLAAEAFVEDEAHAFDPEPEMVEEDAAEAVQQPEVFATASPEQAEDDFGMSLERELLGDDAGFDAAADVSAGFETEPHDADVGAYAAQPDVPEPADLVSEAVDSTAQDDDGMAEVDMDFGMLEQELAAAVEPAVQQPSAASDPAADDWQPEEPVTVIDNEPAATDEAFGPVFFSPVDEMEPVADEGVAAELSLEDELSALLGESAAKPEAVHEATQPTAEPTVVTTAAPADDWKPAVSTFGRSNFAAMGDSAQGSEPTAAAPVAESLPVEPHEAEEASYEAEADTPLEDTFAEIFGLDSVPDSPEPESQPEMQQQPAATGVEALATWQPERTFSPAAVPAAPVASSAAAPAAPDIETIDVAESAQAMVDDLDIPELDYGAPAPSGGIYDDLEGEIAQAFGDMAVDEPAPAAQSPAAPEWGVAAATGAAAYAATAAASAPAAQAYHDHQQPSPDAYAVGEGQWQSDDGFSDDDFNYETDLEQAIAMSSYEDEPAARAQPRNRNLMIAAVVAGVAVVGGVGVFAMSLFGGGSDEPAIVRAGDDPMKVRPENPGGTTVPNQDNEVYQRVTGGASDAPPEQESLISTAEEPVDIEAGGAQQAALPSAMGEVAEEDQPAAMAPEGTDEPSAAAPEIAGAAPKADDRIEPAAEPEGVGASNDVLAVAPRRVRTMVVRSDGTMVPREDPTPAQPEQTNLAAASVGDAQPLAPAGADAQDAGPSVETPATVSVVPSQRLEPQQTAAATAPQPQPVVQQPETGQTPAATPVSAPAAAAPAAGASAWSMQIASQPTAEGAQATYQDLARRYGNVLEGRGVNIVRADIDGMGTYYRVRIPANTRDEAIQLCTRYKAAGGSCFVSR
jgi:hypothetical protein